MPDNNRKVLPEQTIARLNSIYTFSYDKDRDIIVTTLSTCKRVTDHDGSKSFVVISKRLNKKITFSMLDIDIWKSFQNNSKLAKYSLFDVHNTVNKLKAMYQQPDRKNVADMLQSFSCGIRKF